MNVAIRTDRFRRSLAWLGVHFEGAVTGTLQDAGEYMLSAAQATTAWKDRTGATRRGMSERRLGAFRVRFTARGAARLLNDGTRPHVIEARKAKMLRFVVNGQVRFARRVNHPGTRPTHFVDLASARTELFLRSTLTQRLNDAIGRR